MHFMTYDLIIVGGGPAGVAAGVYASRKRLRTLFLTTEWGGQSTVSPDIQNWIGTPSLSGDALAQSLRAHLEAYAGDIVDIIIDRAVGVKQTSDGQYELSTAAGRAHTGAAILVASGSKRRQLTVSGAAAFEHKGLTYCATCDGPLFAGQDVAVIGGGNAGFETAAQLLAYTKSVTLLHRGEQFKADPITVEKVTAHPNMRAVRNAETTAITGDRFVHGLTYFDHTAKAEVTLPVTGIFVEIGMIPNTDFLGDIVARDEYGRITIDPWTQKTSAPNIWAAGDCTNIKYHQNNISAGDGVRALEDIYVTLRTK
jgi:alkyl hydroperoxide reductase subunit F